MSIAIGLWVASSSSSGFGTINVQKFIKHMFAFQVFVSFTFENIENQPSRIITEISSSAAFPRKAA